MSAAETAVRARRKLTNKLIASHEAARLRPFLAPDVKLITGDGGLILGADAVVEAFAGQFRDPAFITYVRATADVRLDQAQTRAAEAGDWTARWRGAGGETTMSGTYLAVWRKVTGQWVLESELYVTLEEPAA
ncbi:nuclear transport factor 2 family protein [Phenylobacterium sp.]|uniref:nuclear transport factor 2 family protein n=1 Tax=Phenylobacterium sp. TaxID=1871053 RepID=UPI0035AE60E3